MRIDPEGRSSFAFQNKGVFLNAKAFFGANFNDWQDPNNSHVRGAGDCLPKRLRSLVRRQICHQGRKRKPIQPYAGSLRSPERSDVAFLTPIRMRYEIFSKANSVND
jgi:hypothetical protein